MFNSRIIALALFLNLIIFGFFGFQGIYDSLQYYGAYKNIGFFRHWIWVFGLPLVAISSLLGLFKNHLAGFVSALSGLCFFLFMTHGFIDWHFDPMEQARNGGVLYFALITLSLAGLNFVAIICLLKRRKLL